MAPGGVLDGADVLVEGGHVVAVGETAAGARELDARGCYVLPGGFDPHAHVYEGLADGTRAPRCARGRPRSRPTLPPSRASASRTPARAGSRSPPAPPAASSRSRRCTSRVRWTRPRSRRSPTQGVRGIKLFLAYRELGMDADDEILVRALLWGRQHGVVPRLHCENAGAIHVLRERLRAAGDLGVDAHPRSRPPLVEEEGIRRALDLARLADAPVYIVHVSTAGGVAAIRRARADGLDVIGRDLPAVPAARRAPCMPARSAAMGVISPPLRPRAHVEAVWEGVLDGTLSAIGSDHSHRGSRPPPRSTSSSRAGRAWRRACR